jgi:DNA-binding MarR family transcriptional regulator
MSARRQDPAAAAGNGLPRLGYLLKHAQLAYSELAQSAFTSLDIRPHAWAALTALDKPGERSQTEVAAMLGVDRTTMVALVDELQGRGLVERLPHAEDRRKNVVRLTAAGRRVMREGAKAADECERRFLAPLDDADAQTLKRALDEAIRGVRRG